MVRAAERLQDLDPHGNEASIYRTRDLVPPHLMSDLRKGYVLITNWHVLDTQEMNQVGGVGAWVCNRGTASDSALFRRVLGKEVGSRGNILVLNDEAHHAYRI